MQKHTFGFFVAIIINISTLLATGGIGLHTLLCCHRQIAMKHPLGAHCSKQNITKNIKSMFHVDAST